MRKVRNLKEQQELDSMDAGELLESMARNRVKIYRLNFICYDLDIFLYE